MADSIVRLRIDSQEYDAKLKKAGDALNRYFDTVRKGGGTLEQLDDGVLDAVKALGSMTTAATSAKGKIGELGKVFTDLHVQYQQMTDAEKNSPLGKEMAQSLEQLKARLKETKGQLAQANSELGITSQESGKAGGIIESLTGKLGLNIKQLGGWGAAMAAGTAALKVAKDAFMSCESSVDEWGRTVEAGKSIYGSFLQSLNSGDFSGFLSNLDNVINKAKEAYNALDELNTRMTIINPERARLQAQATELKATIRREGATSEAGQAAQQQLRALEPKLTRAFQKESQLNYNAFEKEVDRMLSTAGINLGPGGKRLLMQSFSNDDVYSRLKAGASGSITYYSSNRMGWAAPGQPVAPINGKIDTRNTNQKLIDLFTDEWRKQWSPFLTASFSARGSAASVLLGDARYIRSGSGSGGGRSGKTTTTTPKVEEVLPVGSVAALNKEIQELRKEQEKVTDITAWQEYQTQIDALTGKVKILKGQIADPNKIQKGGGTSVLGLAIGQDELSNVEKQLADMLPKDGIKIPAKIDLKTDNITQQSKEMTNDWKQAASAIQSVGQAMQSIEDPVTKVSGTVAQAIATIALSYAEAMKVAAETTGPWGWIGLAGTGLATMLSTISAIKSAVKGYAEGGRFRGKSMSGDNNIIGINDGEVILNRAQQGNIASQLDGGREGGSYRPSYISGEQIYLALNRYTRRTGRGEIVTWR